MQPRRNCTAPTPRGPGKVDGKIVTRTLTADQAKRYRPWFDTARRLRELLAELERLPLDHAQTTDDWPRT